MKTENPRLPYALAAGLCLALAACSGALEPAPDAGGRSEGDAGAAWDAASPDDALVDGGAEAWDAGTDLPDAGEAGFDAGTEPVDAGVEPVDAGPEAVDAGVEPVDAGCANCPADEPIPIEGYGAATRGGWQPGHDVVFVTSLDDDGPGTLREALRTNDAPRIVRFALDGTIHLASALLVPSNLTIDGRGRSVALADKGLILVGTDDVIVTHLTIENVLPTSDDGIRIGDPAGPSERVVVDHVTLRHTDGKGDSKFTDEALSVVFGSTDITIAWCLVEGWEKVFLFGNGDAPASVDGNIRVTVHHTHAHDTGRRHPQARFGTYDFYDNFWDGWHMYGWYLEPPWRDAFGMLCERDCRLRAENNLFFRVPDLHDALSRANDATVCDTGGVIEEHGSAIVPGSTAPLAFGVNCPANAQVPRPYAATVEPADDGLRQRILAGAGNVGP